MGEKMNQSSLYLKDFTFETVVERLIILITGASGCGKTTLLKTLESMMPEGQVAMHYFDSLGVPSLEEMIEQYGSPEEWQKITTEKWIEKLAAMNEPKLLILEGSFNPEFAINHTQKLGLQNVLLFCLHAERSVREHRLIHDRKQPDLANQDMENFAQFLKCKAEELGGFLIESDKANPIVNAKEILSRICLSAQSKNLNREIIEWALAALASQGYTLKSNEPESVKHSLWSDVVRFETTEGYLYLKHTPKLLALEAPITQILHDQFRAPVPEIIAHNAALDCFLIKDAGKPLREILKENFDITLLLKAIDQFTSMQLTVADHVDIFLDIGVPDWRLDKLPDLYQQLLLEKALLIADGLSEIEINTLKTLTPKVSNLCQKLLGYGIKQSLVQPDFHDNNILISNFSKNINFIDLGEIVISHPFFSLVTCMQQIKKHHGRTDKDEVYLKIMNACLKNYGTLGSQQDLWEAFSTAQLLHFIYAALATDRLMTACGKEKLMEFQPGKLGALLREFLAANIAID
jgi:energy-coupling factor transporter ATP-binding protein EcfA2